MILLRMVSITAKQKTFSMEPKNTRLVNTNCLVVATISSNLRQFAVCHKILHVSHPRTLNLGTNMFMVAVLTNNPQFCGFRRKIGRCLVCRWAQQQLFNRLKVYSLLICSFCYGNQRFLIYFKPSSLGLRKIITNNWCVRHVYSVFSFVFVHAWSGR
jgi:hypothetical protein